MREPNDTQKVWEEFVATEIARLTPILAEQGYTLEKEQPHTKGERFLMQAVTTAHGRKVILLGKDRAKKRVLIKATSDPRGIHEIEHERALRTKLHTLAFAYKTFNTPNELLHVRSRSHVVNIQEYIEQTSAFIDRPQKEQFAYALSAFKEQESVHATTASHIHAIRSVFDNKHAAWYLKTFATFTENITQVHKNSDVGALLKNVATCLHDGHNDIERYTGFLTHTDFVPHNFRIRDGVMYLLDYSSLRFGNKHEGWARFINFMTLYNSELETALIEYVKQNRSIDEQQSLYLMRLYRLGEIISYYSNLATKCSGDLQTLNEARAVFWTTVLKHTFSEERVPQAVLTEYRKLRDSLRSKDEKERQKNLH